MLCSGVGTGHRAMAGCLLAASTGPKGRGLTSQEGGPSLCMSLLVPNPTGPLRLSPSKEACKAGGEALAFRKGRDRGVWPPWPADLGATWSDPLLLPSRVRTGASSTLTPLPDGLCYPLASQQAASLSEG